MSLFSDRKRRPLRLTFLFVEMLTEVYSEVESPDGVNLPILEEAARRSGVSVPLTDEQVSYLVSRLADEVVAPSGGAEKQKKKQRGFGDFWLDHYSGVRPEEMCLVLSGMDIERADRLYCEEDKEDVVRLYGLFLRSKIEDNRLLYEGPLMGFGGSYGTQPSAEADTKMPSEMKKMLNPVSSIKTPDGKVISVGPILDL